MLGLWLFLYNKDKFNIVIGISLVSMIVILFVLMYFYMIFPIGDELPQFGFYGTEGNYSWGPGIGFYLCIAAFVLNLILVLNIFKVKKTLNEAIIPEETNEISLPQD